MSWFVIFLKWTSALFAHPLKSVIINSTLLFHITPQSITKSVFHHLIKRCKSLFIPVRLNAHFQCLSSGPLMDYPTKPSTSFSVCTTAPHHEIVCNCLPLEILLAVTCRHCLCPEFIILYFCLFIYLNFPERCYINVRLLNNNNHSLLLKYTDMWHSTCTRKEVCVRHIGVSPGFGHKLTDRDRKRVCSTCSDETVTRSSLSLSRFVHRNKSIILHFYILYLSLHAHTHTNKCQQLFTTPLFPLCT